MHILITGANGYLGQAVLTHLREHLPSAQLSGLVRDPQKAAALRAQDVELRVGDYGDIPSLERAMRGMERVLLISGGEADDALQQHCNVIDAAKRAGVAGLAYTGRSLKDPHTLANTLMRRHFQTEDYLRASGLAFVLFRNALYLDVIPGFVGQQVLETGIQLPAGQGQVAFALRSEMGEAIAKVLAQPVWNQPLYTLTGAEAVGFQDVATALSALSGRSVTYTPLALSTYVERMQAQGLPPALIQKLAGFLEDISQGQEATVSPDLATLLGRPPASLQQGLQQLYAL
ncbi:MAG: SDR family oxidoreductase [Candidatus Sericytochromatia bacterium]